MTPEAQPERRCFQLRDEGELVCQVMAIAEAETEISNSGCHAARIDRVEEPSVESHSSDTFDVC